MAIYLTIAYFCLCIAITVFVLVLLLRFVRAHESIARSLKELATISFIKNVPPEESKD